MDFEINVVKAYLPGSRENLGEEPVEPSVHPLDSPAAQERLRKLMDWWRQAREAHADNRQEMAIDADFYDGDQWTEDEKNELAKRHQAPLVFNIVKQSVDWIGGTEKKTRIDWRVIPRGEEDVDAAGDKEQLLKYIGDVSRAEFERSEAFDQAVISGLGWLEIGVRADPEDEPIFFRAEDWRNVWVDPMSRDQDLEDARFLFRSKWVDTDIARAMFPERARQIDEAACDHAGVFAFDEYDDLSYDYTRRDGEGRVASRSVSGWVQGEANDPGNRRQRVRLIECWFREPARTQVMRGMPSSPLNGLDFDMNDPAHVQARDSGLMSVHDAIKMKIYFAVFAGKSLLHFQPSPYHHNRFPFVPVWGFRRGRDGMPYGVVRNIRDPQADLNKRMSKSLFLLSTNQIIADRTAVEDWDEVAEEAARPDGIIRVNTGKQFNIQRNADMASGHLQLAEYDKAFVRDVSGVQGESVGAQTNAVSGRAILAKQNEGAVVTFKLFDSLRQAVQLSGEILLSLVEQFYDEPKLVRIIGERGKVEFKRLNDAVFDQAAGQWLILNPITQSKADFVVDTRDFRNNVRQSLADQMSDLMARMPPEVGLSLLDLWVDLFDIPGKDDFLARIRQINGQSAPGEQATPEQDAAKQQQAQAKQAQEELARKELESRIQERMARARKLEADAQQAAVRTQTTALQGAEQVVQQPQTAPVADEILRTAGVNNAQ